MFVILILLTSCQKKSAPTPTATPLTKGFGLSPKGFPLDYTQITAFFTEVGGISNCSVMWNGAWRDDATNGTNAGTIPAAAGVVESSGTSNHFTPVVVFGWRSGSTLYLKVPTNSTNDWTNTDAQSAFTSMLKSFAAKYTPPYIFLGNENDFYYEQSSSGYANWLTYYNIAYSAIKATSPATLVGPVFNVEHTAGTGALNGWTTTHWNAIDLHDFSKIDIVGLTLYPWFNYATAASVPSTYLDQILTHLQGKPFAITETGWPAENLGSLNPSWETSATAQVTYVTQLAAILHGKSVKFANWLDLYPEVDPGGSPVDWKLFGSISVRDSSGAQRSVYSNWSAFNP